MAESFEFVLVGNIFAACHPNPGSPRVDGSCANAGDVLRNVLRQHYCRCVQLAASLSASKKYLGAADWKVSFDHVGVGDFALLGIDGGNNERRSVTYIRIYSVCVCEQTINVCNRRRTFRTERGGAGTDGDSRRVFDRIRS